MSSESLDQLPKSPAATPAATQPAQPTRNLLRVRHGHSRVSFVELFFDLVFAFAITRLSHTLIEHFTQLGALQTVMLMLVVWFVWIDTTWVTNWLDPDRLPVRFTMLVLMLLSLILATALPRAFESSGLIFAGVYVLCQLGRTLFFIWAVRDHIGMVRNFQRILVWATFVGAIWIVGAFAHDTARLILWLVGLAVELAGPALGFRVPGLGRSTPADWEVEGNHFAERCALFIIIALGETILLTGSIFGELAWTLDTVIAFLFAFLSSILMWWLYFDITAEMGSRAIASSAEPGRLARLAYTYIHLFIVAGIILAAVADELVLHHPTGHTEFGVALSIVGSTLLYLLGNLLFKRAIVGVVSPVFLTGIIALLILLPVSALVSPVVLSGFTVLVMGAIAVWARLMGHRQTRLAASEVP